MKRKSMFGQYTEQARRVVFFARYEASCQSAEKISTAHLLLGLIREGGSRAEAVGSLKENEVQIRTALGIPTSADKPDKASLMWDMPLSDNSKMVLAYAADEANLDHEYWIETDHLLRGILRFPNEATAALQSISLDLNKAREASRRHRKEFPLKKTLYHRIFGRPIRAHRILFMKWLIFLIVLTLGSLLIRWIN
jgi:ATP-dependent Clp protease ATP-binding subunit ClpC